MEPGEIEFVHSESVAAGEPVAEAWPPPRRHGALRWVMVAVIAAAGITWGVTQSHRHGGQDPVAITPPASTPVPPSPVPTLSADPGILTFQPARDVVTCNDVSVCHVVGLHFDAAIDAAVAQYLPQAVVTSINSTIGADHSHNPVLTERIVEAHFDSVDVLVRVRPYLRPNMYPTTGITPTPPGLGSAFFRVETPSYVVDVQWTGTDTTPPPVDALTSLADDPRLESLG